MGFSVPLAAWFRGPLRQRVREAVLGERLSDIGWFDTKLLRRLVDDHQSGARDYSATLWSLMMYEAFMRHAGAGATLPASSSPQAREAVAL